MLRASTLTQPNPLHCWYVLEGVVSDLNDWISIHVQEPQLAETLEVFLRHDFDGAMLSGKAEKVWKFLGNILGKVLEFRIKRCLNPSDRLVPIRCDQEISRVDGS